MWKILYFILFFILGTRGIFANELPFTDIKKTDPYYNAVKKLYDGGIITKTSDNLFRPNDLMNRDFYVSLTVGVGCKKCSIPDESDMIRYQYSPFIDLPKTNPYYYCIAYAADKQITEGYTLDNNNQTMCEDGKTYSTSPFCASNTISRIEATAILLRRSNLWNETLNNSSFDKGLFIPDVSSYWYGYAKKGIESGIISQKSDGTIGQDEKITRAEFAMMAAKILDYNQCQLNTAINYELASAIGVQNQNNELIKRSTFINGEIFSLIPITSIGTWNYAWTLTHKVSGEVLRGTGYYFDGQRLTHGPWGALLDIIDPQSNKVVSQPSMTLYIQNISKTYDGTIGIRDREKERFDSVFKVEESITLFHKTLGETGNISWEAREVTTKKQVFYTGRELPGKYLGIGEWKITLLTRNKETNTLDDTDERTIHIIGSDLQTGTEKVSDLSVGIKATPLVGLLSEEIRFESIVTGGSPDNTYKWDFGDGNISNEINPIHSYTLPGIYIVTLTVSDNLNNIDRQARVIIQIIGERDSDGDGIYDSSDKCKNIRGREQNSGCPLIATNDYYTILSGIYSGNPLSDSSDTDGDGIYNISDICPLVFGVPSNQGCPLGNDSDSDGDGILDIDDRCPKVPGTRENYGCPSISLFDNIGTNACLLKKLNEQGIILASPLCTTCPCENSLSLLSQIRSCDIIFPSILSPDKEDVYARGGFFVVP